MPTYSCVYCGSLAQDRDHVIPYCTTTNSRGKNKRTYPRNKCVPACITCNRYALGDLPLNTVGQRAGECADWYDRNRSLFDSESSRSQDELERRIAWGKRVEKANISISQAWKLAREEVTEDDYKPQ